MTHTATHSAAQAQFSNDRHLVEQLLANDQRAFDYVVQHFYPSLYAVATAICGHSIADEIVQEAWVSMLHALPKFEGRSSLKSWMTRIVANESKSRLRKERRQVSLEQIQQDWATDPRFTERGNWAQPTKQWHTDTPEEIMAAEQLQDCVEHHLRALPENQEAILAMRDMAGVSMEEICNILQVSASNARVLLHRARDKMLRVIDKFERTGEC